MGCTGRLVLQTVPWFSYTPAENRAEVFTSWPGVSAALRVCEIGLSAVLVPATVGVWEWAEKWGESWPGAEWLRPVLCPLWGTGDACWDPITLGQSRYSALVCVTALCAFLLKPRCFGACQLCHLELAKSPLAPGVMVTLSCRPLPGIRLLSAQITPLQHTAPLPRRQQKSLSLKTNNLATVTHMP